MEFVVIVMGLTGLVFALFIVSLMLGDLLSPLTRNKAWKTYRLIIKEHSSGVAQCSIFPCGPACHTRSVIRFSGGIIETSLDPVSSPFGIYHVTSLGVKDLSDSEIEWLGKRLHNWLN